MIENTHGVELFLDLLRRRDRTVKFDQRLGKIVGDCDVLESIK